MECAVCISDEPLDKKSLISFRFMKTTKTMYAVFLHLIFHYFNSSDSIVVIASAFGTVGPGLIPSRVEPMT